MGICKKDALNRIWKEIIDPITRKAFYDPRSHQKKSEQLDKIDFFLFFSTRCKTENTKFGCAESNLKISTKWKKFSNYLLLYYEKLGDYH